MNTIAALVVTIFVSLAFAGIVSATDPITVKAPVNNKTANVPATRNRDAVKDTRTIQNPGAEATPAGENSNEKARNTVTSTSKQAHDDARKIIDNLK